MADSFYMVLPSNVSLQTFPDKRPGLYRIRLPERLRLQGHWKVGLVNLIFPSTFVPPTMDPLTVMVSLGNMEIGPFNITVTDTIKTMGDLVFATRLTLEKKKTEHGLNLSDHIRFSRDTLWKIEIRTFGGSTLGFNEYLARKLGLLTDNGSISVVYYDAVSYRDNFVYILPESVVRLNVDREDPLSMVHSLKEHVLNLYVYADIVETHPVGDTQANLLRIVPVKDEEGRIVSEEFATPLYFRVSRTHLNTVTIFITDDNGYEVPFEDATVQVTLHFDRTQTPWCQDHPLPLRLIFPPPPVSLEEGVLPFSVDPPFHTCNMGAVLVPCSKVWVVWWHPWLERQCVTPVKRVWKPGLAFCPMYWAVKTWRRPPKVERQRPFNKPSKMPWRRWKVL